VPPGARNAATGCFATVVLVAFLGTGCLGGGTAPANAPAEKRLLFVAEDDGYVFTIDTSGHALRQLTRGNDWGARRGVWSPDGTRIAVVTEKVPDERNAAVLVMSRDGRNRRRLAFLPSAEAQLSWRSEKTIGARAYTGFHRVEVSTVDAVHGGRRRIVRIERYRPGVLSPDGTRLAFERTDRHGDTQIYVARPDRSRAVNVSRSRSKGPSRLVEAAESWSPDGTRLAFTLDRGLGSDTREVRVMHADGSGERMVAPAPHLRGFPEWSPGGRSLAWVADADDDGLDELYVAAVKGGRPRRLVERTYIQDIEWEPGGARAAPPSAGSGPPATRLIRTYSRDLAKGRARLSDVRLLRRFASDSERPTVADLSSDGALLALIWRGEIGVLDLRTNRIRPVATSRPAGWYPQALFAPDGRSLLYRRWDELLLLDLRTGRTTKVARTSSWGQFAWLADGRVAFGDRGRLKLVRPGDRPRRMSGVSKVGTWSISPRGRRLLYNHRCETFLLDRISGKTRRLSGHMFVPGRAWSPDGTHFVLQWAEDCKPKTEAIWAYHTYDVLYNRAGDQIAGLSGHGATWSADGGLLFVYYQPTGTEVHGLEALEAVDLERKRESILLAAGNADSEAFIGPGAWVVFARYDEPWRVSHYDSSGALYLGRLVGR